MRADHEGRVLLRVILVHADALGAAQRLRPVTVRVHGDGLGGLALRFLHQANRDEVLLDHVADLGHQRGDVTAIAEIAAVRIENRFQFFNQEGRIAGAAEDGRDQARHGDNPTEMLQVLAVDENLEGPAAAVFSDVVDRDVERLLAERRLDLVSGAL